MLLQIVGDLLAQANVVVDDQDMADGRKAWHRDHDGVLG
jgi:hypothetical protein